MDQVSERWRSKRLFDINFWLISPPGIYEVPSEVSKPKAAESAAAGPFTEPVSAILAPSSITHRTSPQLNLRARELSPTAHDTGKDTQQLVEEEDC